MRKITLTTTFRADGYASGSTDADSGRQEILTLIAAVERYGAKPSAPRTVKEVLNLFLANREFKTDTGKIGGEAAGRECGV